MAELRYLTIPKNIDVYVARQPYGFVMCAVYVIDRHPIFSQTGAGIRAAARIVGLIDGKKPGDVVVLDEQDWSLVHQAFEAPYVAPNETPDVAFIPPLGDEKGIKVLISPRRFTPYLNAVSDEATKKMPDSHVMQNGVPVPLPEAAQA